MFEGAPLVLLTTVGARTGRRRTNPAVYLRDGERVLVFASNAGGPADPAFTAYQEGTDRVIPVVALYRESERLRAFGDELAGIYCYLRGEPAKLRACEDRIAFPHLEKLSPS